MEEYLMSFGFDKQTASNLVKRYPLCNLKEDTLKNNIESSFDFFIKLGLNKEEIIKMAASAPSMFSYSADTMDKKIEGVMELGYTMKEVIRMTIKASIIYFYSVDNIKNKIADLENLGYTKDQIIDMTVKSPQIFSYNIDNIKNKINDIKNIGYTNDEVISMTTNSPSIFGLSIENLKPKLEYYDFIGLHDLALKDPKHLIQSVNLSYARFEFFRENNIDITMENYRKLFVSEKQFETQYKINNKDLMKQYDYNTEFIKYDKETGEVM